jgi:hypothetical protein
MKISAIKLIVLLYLVLKFCRNWRKLKKVTSNQSWVHPHGKPEIRIFLRKRLVRKLGKTDLSKFFTQHYEHMDVSSVKISHLQRSRQSMAEMSGRHKDDGHCIVFG